VEPSLLVAQKKVSLAPSPSPAGITLRVENGQVAYEYRPDFTTDLRGPDSFTYRVGDGYAESNVARIDIVVPNSRPIAYDFNPYPFTEPGLSILGPDGSTSVTADLIEDAFDLEGDPLQAVVGPFRDDLGNFIGAPQHGSISLSPEGLVTYVPHPGFHMFGSDRFAYRVFDGYELSEIAWVTIHQALAQGFARTEAFTVAQDSELVIGPGVLYSNDHFENGLPADLRDSNGRYLFIDRGEAQDWCSCDPARPGRLFTDYPTAPGRRLQLNDDGSLRFVPKRPVDDSPGFLGVASIVYKFAYLSRGFETADRWSNTADVLVDVTETPESDSDGVADNIEVFVPYAHGDTNGDGVDDALQFRGDGNGDGVFDRHQAHVAAVPEAGSFNLNQADWIVFVAEPGTTLFDVQAIPTPDIGNAPQNVQFDLGFFSFRVVGLAPGEATSVTLYPRSQVRLTTYYKYGVEPNDNAATPNVNERVTPHWYEFLYDGETGAEIFDDNADSYTDRIVLHFVDGRRGDDDRAFNGVILDPGGPASALPPPQVQSVVINDGHAQRSMVRSITVAFDQRVTVAPGAFTLRQLDVPRAVGVSVTLAEREGRTVARLTFSGAGVVGGSLADGRFRLTILGQKIRGLSGERLDGNADGAAGGNRVDEFFRWFGDTDGDGDVDQRDSRVFQSAFGKRRHESGYLWYLDFNNNGRIWAEDKVRFLINQRCRVLRR
jgi:hypothetical protein